MKKTLLITLLAVGLIFSACQKIGPAPAETPIIKEEANTKTLESSIFSITVPANLTIETTENGGRIQNFTPDSDLYILKDGEYFIGIIFNITDETYSEDVFRSEYKTVEESDLNGEPALYGIDRLPAGDSPTGVGYYIYDTLVIGIYSKSESGIANAKKVLENFFLKDSMA